MKTWAVIERDYVGEEYTRGYVLGDDFCDAVAKARKTYPSAIVKPINDYEEEVRAINEHICAANYREFERLRARA